MKKTAVVILQIVSASTKRVVEKDLEVPMDIAAERLIMAIANAYNLGNSTTYLTCENPIAFIQGNNTLADYGVHDGSIIRYVC